MSLWTSAFCMIGMVLLILAEVVLRGVFNSTTEHSDELVGLPAGRPVVPEPGALPEPRRLPSRRDGADAARARGQAVSALVFDLAVLRLHRADRLVFPAVRHELLPPRGDGQHSALGTPLWIPETAMIVGAVTAADRAGPGDRRRRPEARLVSAGLRVLLVLVIFLGLLAAGMAIPFAIGVPAIVYLLVHGGVPALRGIGLMSWGSMNSFALTAIPLFILMAEIMQHSGPELPDLSRPVEAGLRHPGRPAADQHRRLRAVRGDLRLFGGDRGGHRHAWRCRSSSSAAITGPLAAGSLAAGGTLGILIPPSIAHDRLRHLHRDLGVEAVHGRHRAGPAADGAVHGLRAGACADPARDRAARKGPQNLAEFGTALADLLPFVIVIGGTMGSLYFGWATPTEAAAIGCLAGFRRLGDLGQARLERAQGGHDLVGDDQRQHILLIVYTAFVFSYAISVAGVGEQLTTWMVGLNLSRLEFFFALFILYTMPGLPGRKPGHDRDHRAAALSGAAEVRHRSGVVRHHPGAVHRARADLAADRHQPVRDPEHLGRQAVRHRLGHDPFHLLMFVLLVMLVFWPEIALWLPHHMSAPP